MGWVIALLILNAVILTIGFVSVWQIIKEAADVILEVLQRRN